MVTSDWGGQCTWYRRGWSSGFTGEVTFAQSLPPPQVREAACRMKVRKGGVGGRGKSRCRVPAGPVPGGREASREAGRGGVERAWGRGVAGDEGRQLRAARTGL